MIAEKFFKLSKKFKKLYEQDISKTIFGITISVDFDYTTNLKLCSVQCVQLLLNIKIQITRDIIRTAA